ncbi:MolR family transcriptional regulator [Hymenobacter taeanensis]|uniref:MolR family transcriptional regulator n=1 Tax=Hymenobacter taeanensis TaxID=2735321 RepID=A0A6M6BEJ1_9BACT|nr:MULTISPECIES: MolR family transcriptional regulator [Hymenobacter]QJX46154.1 MolR family transcriptional regulator [Hymenobacter taeanensis]UOQ80010.1 hypothetical protein MUN83_14310 [Hymenobacter sp. 5414T-23]
MKPQKFYFDDEEEGLAIQTSHPNFTAVVKEEFYFDCVDDFSPFGNDDGADALLSLTEWYQETRGRNKIVNWLFRTIDEYGFSYQSKWASGLVSAEELQKLEKEDPSFIGCMDRTIIGVGFGQCKITGSINVELKQLVKTAIARQKMIHEKDLAKGKQIHGDVGNDFGNDEKLLREYLDRLDIMERDLSAFKEA